MSGVIQAFLYSDGVMSALGGLDGWDYSSGLGSKSSAILFSRQFFLDRQEQ
jgi:hypothetical protein